MVGAVWSSHSPSPTGETWIILCHSMREARVLANEWGVPSYLYPSRPDVLRGIGTNEHIRFLVSPSYELRADYFELTQLVNFIDATSTHPVQYIYTDGQTSAVFDPPPPDLHDVDAVESWLAT